MAYPGREGRWEEGRARCVLWTLLFIYYLAGRKGTGVGFKRATHQRSGRRRRGTGLLGWLSAGQAR